MGAAFHWSTAVTAVTGAGVATSRGPLCAAAVVVCPGDDFATLHPERFAPHGLSVCTLQMLRVAPARPVRFGAAVMSDLSFARCEGFKALPEAAALTAEVARSIPISARPASM